MTLPTPFGQGMYTTRWWLVRHAAPLIAPGTCYGALDVAADAEATAQAAKALVQMLDKWAAAYPDQAAHGLQLVCSPLQRCRQLADALLQQMPCRPAMYSLTLHLDARLAEMDFGAWEGQPWSSIPSAEWKQWMDDFAHWRVGGHGESVAQLMQRVQAAAHAHAHATSHRTMLWITHAGVMRALHLWRQGINAGLLHNASQWPVEAACGYGQWLDFF